MGNAKTKPRMRHSPFAADCKQSVGVSELCGDWSTLQPEYIDKVAEALKRSGRWSLDGASLRAVNRHWKTHLDMQVHRIDPHWSRNLFTSDFRSLVHFSNLRMLSLGSFLISCDILENEVVTILARLPNLSSLELILSEETLRFLKADNIEQLKSVKKVIIGSRRFMDKHLEYFEQMRRFPSLEEVFLEGHVKCLGAILDELPSLKRLSVFSTRKKIQDSLTTKLRRLDELKLGYHRKQPFNASRLPSLTALEMNVDSSNVEWLSALTQLTSLRLNLLSQAVDVVNTSAFNETLKTLKSLAISCSNQQQLILDLKGDYPLLKELALHGFRIFGTQLKENLTHVTKLKLKHCLMEEVEVLRAGMHKMETLFLQDCWDSHYKDMSLFWKHEDAPRLKALYTEVSVVRSETQIEILSEMSCVEHLMLEFIHPQPHGSVMTVKGLNQLTKLANLRKLGFLGLHRWPDLLTNLPLEFLHSLETFGVGRYDPQHDKDEWIIPLRRMHSRLKFNENGRMFQDLEEFDPSFF